MIIKNLTPHDINIVRITEGEIENITTIPQSGIVLRLKETKKDDWNIYITHVEKGLYGFGKLAEYEVSVQQKEIQECENLPEKEEDTFLIVSRIIASILRRDDLLVPNTVSDEKGKIIGCDSFIQIL